MSREKRYQQGNFDHYLPERDEMQTDFMGREYAGYTVRAGRMRDVGGTFVPGGPDGSHRGKGPRNYQRRDDRILEDVNDRMCDNPYLDATEIDISVSEGDVVLSGLVENRESKRLAEDIVESIAGVQNVENRLRVKKFGI